MPVSGDASSTTKSAIEAGATITITGNQTQDLSGLSRDTGNSLNVLGKIFDKETVKEKQELANLFSQEANKAIGDLAESMRKKATTDEEKAKWAEGGEYKALLHAVSAGIVSSMTGNGFASGAAGDGISQLAQKELANITDPNLRLIASSIVGAAAAKAVGGNAQAGASAAFSGVKNNDYNHRTHREGEIVHTKDGFFKVIDGVDTAIAPPAAGVYFWEEDANSPDYGWDYKKGDGVNTVDTYFSGVVTGQHYFEWNGNAYGFTTTAYTDEQKHEILVDAGKRWAEAELAALSGGGTFGGLGAALEAGTAARTLMAEQILSVPRGARPDPATYLPKSFIDTHLANFEGGVTKISAGIREDGVVGSPVGTFVMPNNVANRIIEQSGGNVSKMEELLGLNPGDLGANPVRIDISSPSGLRIPSGNEPGVNSQWRPGGYTSGGIPEAVINQLKPGEYTLTAIK